MEYIALFIILYHTLNILQHDKQCYIFYYVIEYFASLSNMISAVILLKNIIFINSIIT